MRIKKKHIKESIKDKIKHLVYKLFYHLPNKILVFEVVKVLIYFNKIIFYIYNWRNNKF